MALKIVKSSEPIRVDRLNIVIYGPPGLGKSSLAFTAEAPLLLDFDGGAHRASNRKEIVQVRDWSEIGNITADDVASYRTIVIDTAGRALDCLTNEIIKTEPKGHKNGALTLPGFGILKTRFATFLKRLNSFGKDVVLIAHMDEQRNGDDVIERLDVQGGSKNEIYKAADAMGRLALENGQRWLKFSPTDAAFGKNPGQLEPLAVPKPEAPEFTAFLAGVIQSTKDWLNELTEEQRQAVAEQQWFRDNLPAQDSAEKLNGLLGRAKAAGDVVKAMLHKRATELGIVFDKDAGKYAPKPEPKPEPSEPEKAVA
jgi:hypothetical protein